jgi:hypothetical protein
VLWSHGTGWEPSEIEKIAKEARPFASADRAESKERAATPGSQVLFRSTLRSLLKPDERPLRAILFDDGTGHSLDTLELARVTNTITESIQQPLDFLGMDACLMANLEVAYEVRKTVRYLVASEELCRHTVGHTRKFSAHCKRPRAWRVPNSQNLSLIGMPAFI